jgi:hypothetical protein
MVLALAQNRHEGKWNRRPRYESMLKTYEGEKSASSTNVAGKTGYLHAYILYTYQLKVD